MRRKKRPRRKPIPIDDAIAEECQARYQDECNPPDRSGSWGWAPDLSDPHAWAVGD